MKKKFAIDDRSTWASKTLVGERIHKLRIHEKMTRAEFCEKLYVCIATYTQWRAGHQYPSPTDIRNIMDVYGVTAQDLLGPESRIDGEEYGSPDRYQYTDWCGTDASKRIRELMEERRVSRKRLAKALKVTPTTVSNWRKGNNKPNKEGTEKLAAYFGMSVEELLRGR